MAIATRKQLSTAEAVRVFKLLADESRLRLLLALAREKELSVGALCEAVGRSQPATSHNLTLLRVSGVVTRRREGKQIYYSLASPYLSGLLKTIKW